MHQEDGAVWLLCDDPSCHAGKLDAAAAGPLARDGGARAPGRRAAERRAGGDVLVLGQTPGLALAGGKRVGRLDAPKQSLKQLVTTHKFDSSDLQNGANEDDEDQEGDSEEEEDGEEGEEGEEGED